MSDVLLRSTVASVVKATKLFLPASLDVAKMLALADGPLIGISENGAVVIIVDSKCMHELVSTQRETENFPRVFEGNLSVDRKRSASSIRNRQFFETLSIARSISWV